MAGQFFPGHKQANFCHKEILKKPGHKQAKKGGGEVKK